MDEKIREKLASLNTKWNESVLDYVARAEDIHSHLQEIDKGFSEQVVGSILL